MKKLLLSFICIISCALAFTQTKKDSIALIPKPVSLVTKAGQFVLPAHVVIVADNNEAVKKLANRLADVIKTTTGKSATVQSTKTSVANSIRLQLTTSKFTPAEGYKLDVSPTGVLLEASTPAGLFYGTQTLLQLLPPEINSKTTVSKKIWSIPTLAIVDSPRFGWRGVMLDVARHFFTKQQVKDFIDEMVSFKFNMLHLHLTDDEGWRIEIKSLPKLTEVGAWRAPRTGLWGKFTKPSPDEPQTYGGFYTHEDIKEIVQYAKDRYVNI